MADLTPQAPQSSQAPQKNLKDSALQFAIFIAIVSAFVFISSTLVKTFTSTNEDKVKEVVNEVIKEKEIVLSKPTCNNSPDEFNSLKSKGQSLQLTKNQSTYGQSGKLIGLKSVKVAITGPDDIACGYMYVKASKNSKPLGDNYDSVYIDPQDFGGHLLRNKGIYLTNTKNYTEFLLPLNAVSFLPTLPYNPNAQNFRIADWGTLLNVNSHVYFDIALSTLDKRGLIEDVTIAYKCWDATTGKEGSNCLLSIE